MENELYFTGAIGLEEVIEEKVPQTLKKLKKAGINIWMVSGD